MALERSFFRAYYIVDAGSRRGDRCRTSSPLSSTGKPRRRSTRILRKDVWLAQSTRQFPS